jgi:hypothetical protein
MTTHRSTNRSASLSAIAALVAVLLSVGANARAADRSRDYLDVDEIEAAFFIPDESNMRFGAATVDVQDGHRVVISADATVTAADGSQETRGIIAILIGVVVAPSTGFMDYTDDACMASSDGTSNTIVFGARARAAIARAWNAYVDGRLPALSAGHCRPARLRDRCWDIRGEGELLARNKTLMVPELLTVGSP